MNNFESFRKLIPDKYLEMEEKKVSSTQKGPIKHKFLRRAMDTDRSHLAAIYTKMRRIYFRKIYAFSEEYRWYSHSTRKQLNCLIDLQMTLSSSSRDRKVIKNLKNLKNISILLKYHSPIKPLVRNIKELPKKIETITISGNVLANPAKIDGLYKNLSNIRKLRKLEKELSFNQDPRDLTEIEYNSINKYLPRLNKFKELSCVELRDGEEGLYKFMSQGRECRLVTELTLNMEEYFSRSNISCASLFRFQVFPRLNRLKISSGVGMSLDSSVIQGLESLSELKQFTLDLQDRFEGAKLFFDGLARLPLLDLFQLSIPDIENDEELLLIKFLQRQTQLVSLTLFSRSFVPSRERYEEQNRNLEIICQSLNGMPRLKYLHLNASVWSLETLSRGLNHVGLTNQLKELKIGGFDDISITSPASPGNKVKGLCDFIERQKLTLRCLSMTIDCVKEDEIIDNLIRAAGEADQLESLYFSVNNPYSPGSLKLNQLLADIPRESLKGYPSFNNTFACLNQVLPRLKELSSLNIELNPLFLPIDAPVINSLVIFESLSSLKRLRSLILCLPFLRESLRTHPGRVLKQLSKLDTLNECFISTADDNDDYIKEITEALEKTQQQRNFRQSLALYSF